MESNSQQLRLEVTYHDPQTSSILKYAIHKITVLCQQLGFQLVLPTSGSCNHYIKPSHSQTDLQGNINDKKQLFEITYLNIIVFSKVASNQLPDYHLLRLILVRIKKMGRQLKRKGEILKITHQIANIPVMYDFVKEYCQMQYSQRKVNEALTKFIYGKLTQSTAKIKAVTPYSYFSENMKHQKMLDIYQPNTSREIKTLHLKTRGSPNATNEPSIRSKSRHVLGEKNKMLFDKVRIRDCKTVVRAQKNEINQSQRVNGDNEIKQIYFSYLEKFRPLTKMCVRTVASTQKDDSLETKIPFTTKKHFIDPQRPIDSIRQEKNKEQFGIENEKNPNKSIDQNQSENRYRDIEEQASISTIKKQPKQRKSNQQNRISELEKTTILKYYDQINKLNEAWAPISQQRTKALINCCFIDHTNFHTVIVDHVYDNPKNAESVQLIDFEITGQELTQTTIQKSLKQIYFPSEIKLFPTHFQPIEDYSTNLTLIANMLIQINPQILTRIFQNQKNISFDGIYCIWLRNLSGKYVPIFVNDSFAVYCKQMQREVIQFWNSRDLAYSKPGPENCIWFMLLEKAVAKVVGGYHNIEKTSLSKLLSIILGCPVVGFTDLTAQRVIKVLQQKTFYNKMAIVYAHHPNMHILSQIINFQLHQEELKNSKMALKSITSIQDMRLSEFLKSFGELVLSFFNLSYVINQYTLKTDKPDYGKYSCRIISKRPKNNCYLFFSFGKLIMKHKCKVVIYRQTNQSNEEKKTGYEYFGEIKREGDFFFEDQFQLGSYLCVLQGDFVNLKECADRPHLVTYSQYQVVIQDSKSGYLKLAKKKETDSGIRNKRSPPQHLIQNWDKQSCRIRNQWTRRNNSPKNKLKMRKKFMVDEQFSETDKENNI